MFWQGAIIKRLEIKTNLLLINNKRIFAFLWIQKQKRNKIIFFFLGTKQKQKQNVRSQKKGNVDIPILNTYGFEHQCKGWNSHDTAPLKILYTYLKSCKMINCSHY